MLDQAYYWTKEWQEAEAEADADIRDGRVVTFPSARSAIKYLRSLNNNNNTKDHTNKNNKQ